MEVPKEEDSGLSKLGAFFGRNKEAGGSGGGSSLRWDGDTAQRRSWQREGFLFENLLRGRRFRQLGTRAQPIKILPRLCPSTTAQPSPSHSLTWPSQLPPLPPSTPSLPSSTHHYHLPTPKPRFFL